jgi:hypothetical protein
MVTIILEGVLFIALVAVLVALVAYGAVSFTPLGTWIRQTANRRRVEREAALTCPVHGYHPERDLVRLPGGTPTCPECYAEAFHDEPH